MKRYIVVVDCGMNEFSKWYETFDNAKIEAEQLCKKHQCKVVILEEVITCEYNPQPVTWKTGEENEN